MPLESGAQIQFYAAHSEIHFYTWGEKECCLERGSTSATLVDDWANKEPSRQPSDQAEPKATASQSSRERKLRFLKPGDVLIFEEVLGPDHRKSRRRRSVAPPCRSADQSHARRRCAVQTDPWSRFEWAAEDALPFPFCISAIGEAPECKYLENISVARGNVILVDHGRTVGPGKPGTCADVAHRSNLRVRRSSGRHPNYPRTVSPEASECSADVSASRCPRTIPRNPRGRPRLRC